MLVTEQEIHTLHITKEQQITAPIEIVFESLLEQMGPGNEAGAGKPMPMKLEAWPGGRWFRDLGDNAGHFWGHVQVIKPPTVLEICGPMFMSYPAASHLQYRLTPEGSGTRLELTHRAFGQIPADHREGVNRGWASYMERVKAQAEKRAGAGTLTR